MPNKCDLAEKNAVREREELKDLAKKLVKIAEFYTHSSVFLPDDWDVLKMAKETLGDDA